MSEPVHDIDLETEKSNDLKELFLWRHKWEVRSGRRALSFSKMGEEWETKGEKKRHLLKYIQAPRRVL